MSNQQLYKIIETIVLALLTCCAVALGMTSCKAWRTITTTASAYQFHQTQDENTYHKQEYHHPQQSYPHYRR